MKLSTTATQERHGFENVETNQFSIRANGKAFRILLDGLYTNKIRAVVRELWSNAYDAHIAAGCASIPFDCHLPTQMDPTFRVRDYGTSLTHEQVMGLYTTIFESTKDDSDDFVGALGLGSKSPFAYTDQFTVIARLNGEKRTYLASMGADGTPEIALMDRRPSDEAQGLEISMPGKLTDASTFAHEARDLAIGFDPVPDVDGIEIKTAEPVYMAGDSSFGIFRENVGNYEKKVSIRQGCVVYPVSGDHLTRSITSLMGQGTHIILDVPIGAVEIAASREALSLTEATSTYVRETCERAAETLKLEIQERANECSTELEALKFWYAGGNEYGSLFTIPAKYKGRTLSSTLDLRGDERWPDPIRARRPRKKEGFGDYDLHGFNFVGFKDERFLIVTTPAEGEKAPVRSVARINNFADQHRSGRVTILVDPDPIVWKVLTDRLGLDYHTQVFRVSELPDPGPPARVARQRLDGELAGVTDVTTGLARRPAKMTQLPDRFFWFEVPRTTGSEIDAVMDEVSYYKNAGMDLGGLPVLSFTAGARKRFKPDPRMEFRACKAGWLFKNLERLVDTVAERKYNDMMQGAGIAFALDLRNVPNPLYNAATNLLTWEQEQDAQALANEASQFEQDSYPLLFERHDRKAITDYIALCDANRKKK